MEYVVGLIERELEFFYNRSTGLSNWSELDEMDRMEVKMNTEAYIRDAMIRAARVAAGENGILYQLKWQPLGGYLRRQKKASNDS